MGAPCPAYTATGLMTTSLGKASTARAQQAEQQAGEGTGCMYTSGTRWTERQRGLLTSNATNVARSTDTQAHVRSSHTHTQHPNTLQTHTRTYTLPSNTRTATHLFRFPDSHTAHVPAASADTKKEWSWQVTRSTMAAVWNRHVVSSSPRGLLPQWLSSTPSSFEDTKPCTVPTPAPIHLHAREGGEGGGGKGICIQGVCGQHQMVGAPKQSSHATKT